MLGAIAGDIIIIRNAVSLGDDSDTLACITAGIAEALYGVPAPIGAEARPRLDEGLWRFYQTIDPRA
jgi:type I restriction enzyme M protein